MLSGLLYERHDPGRQGRRRTSTGAGARPLPSTSTMWETKTTPGRTVVRRSLVSTFDAVGRHIPHMVARMKQG